MAVIRKASHLENLLRFVAQERNPADAARICDRREQADKQNFACERALGIVLAHCDDIEGDTAMDRRLFGELGHKDRSEGRLDEMVLYEILLFAIEEGMRPVFAQ